MDKKVKDFVIAAANMKKDRSFVRNYLFGKVSDMELKEALDLFDKLSGNKITKISYFFNVLIHFFRIIFLFFFFLFFKVYLIFVRNVSLKKREEEGFSEFKRSILSFGILSTLKNFFMSISEKNKRKIIIFISIFFLVILFFIYSNFFYYKNCENSSCFKYMLEKCNRAKFVSDDFIKMENRIVGISKDKCVVEVVSYDESKNNYLKMVCKLPLGSNILPYSDISYCSGDLREYIQEKILLELNRILGENIDELNYFLKNKN